jgi:hypothetical protein
MSINGTGLRLLTETPIHDQLDILVEEKNTKEPSTMWVQGPYMAAETVNKNKRMYDGSEMSREVDRYIREMVNTNRSMGELNHPASAEVNPERACHLVTELRREGNTYFGKSKILSSPLGVLVRSLINDGVKVGMSSRALGKLVEENSGINRVTSMRLIAVDCVADPSFTKAFVNGILESKQYVLAGDGSYEELYDTFIASVSDLPRKDVENYLKTQILQFIESFKNK